MVGTISPAELAARRDQVVIDVRAPEEFAEEHMPGSIDVPLEQLGQRSSELPEAPQLVLICASGRRSAEGADLLVSRGITAVSVEGGLQAWKEAGHPIERGASSGD